MEEQIASVEGTGAFRCPRCGVTTWGDLKNCPDCGESLTIECPECKGTWRFIYNYRYCPSCGTKVGKLKSKV